ncbi:MspA family porin [Nocardia testacea]|uniref:MspA family porin n=1 Tax=Nocardia testacea TaxID=248551 RepID=A0ABW7VSH4_9NOCA
MHRNRVFGTLAATLGIVFVAVPEAAASAPHEKTYTAGGIEYTVGHTDFAARAVAPVNGMPTNREAVVDNTTYGRFTGSGSGTIKMGYLVGCQLEVGAGLSLDADMGVDGDVGAGVDVDTDGIDPSADAGIGADASAGVGVDLDLAPGEIEEIEIGEKELKAGTTGYFYSRDAHITANNCGGQLTLRGYSIITVDSPEVGASGVVYTDPITL